MSNKNERAVPHRLKTTGEGLPALVFLAPGKPSLMGVVEKVPHRLGNSSHLARN